LAKIEPITVLRMGCSTAGDMIQLLAHASNVRTLEMQACRRWVDRDDAGRSLKQQSPTMCCRTRSFCLLLLHCRLNGVDRPEIIELQRQPSFSTCTVYVLICDIFFDSNWLAMTTLVALAKLFEDTVHRSRFAARHKYNP
jgi:hypothetical protein